MRSTGSEPTPNPIEPLFHCDIRGCVGVAVWRLRYDASEPRAFRGDIVLCEGHTDLAQNGRAKPLDDDAE